MTFGAAVQVPETRGPAARLLRQAPSDSVAVTSHGHGHGRYGPGGSPAVTAAAGAARRPRRRRAHSGSRDWQARASEAQSVTVSRPGPRQLSGGLEPRRVPGRERRARPRRVSAVRQGPALAGPGARPGPASAPQPRPARPGVRDRGRRPGRPGGGHPRALHY